MRHFINIPVLLMMMAWLDLYLKRALTQQLMTFWKAGIYSPTMMRKRDSKKVILSNLLINLVKIKSA